MNNFLFLTTGKQVFFQLLGVEFSANFFYNHWFLVFFSNVLLSTSTSDLEQILLSTTRKKFFLENVFPFTAGFKFFLKLFCFQPTVKILKAPSEKVFLGKCFRTTFCFQPLENSFFFQLFAFNHGKIIFLNVIAFNHRL